MSQEWSFLAEGRTMGEAKSAALAALAELGLSLEEVPERDLTIDVGRGLDGSTFYRVRLRTGLAGAGEEADSE